MRRAPVVAITLVAGCFAYENVPPERPAPTLRKIEDAQLFSMVIDPRNQQPALCPGAKGKLYMTAKVQWPKQKEPVDRNIGAAGDSLHPTAFLIESSLVQGDDQAYLHPSEDVLASVETGFPVHIVYKPMPKYEFKKVFPPEYSCYHGASVNGRDGDNGGPGSPGNQGEEGKNGDPGGTGGDGVAGGNAGTLVVFVTFVKTRYYPKLIAVIANGEFHLAPPDQRLVFSAHGGTGGSGGQGGQGGQGGNQHTEQETRKEDGQDHTYTVGHGPAGNGGQGGTGGNGAGGGAGGTVDITFDAQFPELANLVAYDVQGGAGGASGGGGDGGAPGDSNADENKGRQVGGPGGGGGQGRLRGNKGGNGTPRTHAGSVGGKFNLRGIEPLGRR